MLRSLFCLSFSSSGLLFHSIQRRGGSKILKRIVNFLPVLFTFFLIIFAYARVVLVPRCLHFLYDKKKSGSRKRIGKQTIIITLNEKGGGGQKLIEHVSEQKGIEKKKLTKFDTRTTCILCLHSFVCVYSMYFRLISRVRKCEN